MSRNVGQYRSSDRAGHDPVSGRGGGLRRSRTGSDDRIEADDHRGNHRRAPSQRSTAACDYIAAETIKAKVHRRKNGSIWTEETFMDIDDDIYLPALSTTISLKEIYDSLSGIGT
jgi:hypothetical protein